MESVQASVSDVVPNISTVCDDDGSGKSGISDMHESNNLGEDILHDLDSYLEDIDDRLTISRMVSDSIIKGMVNAVSQEAAEIVAAKELEVDSLKEVMCCQHCNNCELNASTTLRKHVSLIDSNVLALVDRFNEISGLRTELESIRKLFDCSEVGGQGSMEMDHLHRKVSGNHSHLWNGKSTGEESKCNIPENLESSQLQHMKAPELYQHFRTLITEMKREHESAVQQMTEEYFSLKRELLKERELVKERGPFAAFKKDKDFEIVKQKITDVLANLDEIVKENEKLSEFCNHSKDTLDSLLSENIRLKDVLNKQKLEALHFSSQASDATKKLLQHSWAEENLNTLLGDLKCALRDKYIEASVSEEIYQYTIREMDEMINASYGDLDLISSIMPDIFGTVYGEVYHDGVSRILDNGVFDLQSFIEGQISEVVFKQVVKDLSMEVEGWKEKCLKNDELLGFFQSKISEIKNELAEKDDINEDMKNQVLGLENIIEEKDRVLIEVKALYEKERAQLNEEYTKLRDQEVHKSNELVLLKHKLEDFEQQIGKLNAELKVSQDKLRKSDEETINLTSDLNNNYMASIRAKDSEHIKHMEALSHVIQGLSKSFADFELRIKESIGWQCVRLENSAFQLHSFIPKVNVLRRTNSLYKERLEKRCSDLQKAEAEVDLLGDEVDALLSLLDKIYVALDHYSPILQHYPGIIEILKLVKRELTKDSLKGHLTAT